MAALAQIPVEKITADRRAMPRERFDFTLAEEYASLLRQGANFPPLVVFREAGPAYWLARGFAVCEAHRIAGVKYTTCEVKTGGLPAAVLFAAAENAGPRGARRSEGDRRRAVEMVLGHDEGKKWSPSRVAVHCRVSLDFVLCVMADLEIEDSQPKQRALWQDGAECEAPESREIAPLSPGERAQIMRQAVRAASRVLWFAEVLGIAPGEILEECRRRSRLTRGEKAG